MNEGMNLNGIAPTPINTVDQTPMSPLANTFVTNTPAQETTSSNLNQTINSTPAPTTVIETPSIFANNNPGVSTNQSTPAPSILQGNSILGNTDTTNNLMPLSSTQAVGNTAQPAQPAAVAPVIPQIQTPTPISSVEVATSSVNATPNLNNQTATNNISNANVVAQPQAISQQVPVQSAPTQQLQPVINEVPAVNTSQQPAIISSTTENEGAASASANQQPIPTPQPETTQAQPTNETPTIPEGNENYAKNDSLFSNIDFGPLVKYLNDDNVTDISYSNGGQLWLKTLDKGIYREEVPGVNDPLIEKIAFQCSNVMGKTFNMAHPFLDSESAELRMNFVHDSIAKNGVAAVFRKTPAKIRLEKEKIIAEKYVTLNIHDFLIQCVKGHCNIIVSGETGSGKTELVKYLASHTADNEKLITIEDTLELHLDRIFPHRDIVAMKTNNIASYSDVLVTCMRQNPKWILLSEVRSAEAVTAVRNSISSGHNILSTIHSDKAESIPHRMYSLLESNIDVDQFLKTIYRYIQLGVFVRGRYDPNEKRFVREVAEVTEFYVDDDNNIGHNTIYRKTVSGVETYNEPSKYLKSYLEGQGVDTTNLIGMNTSSDQTETETL